MKTPVALSIVPLLLIGLPACSSGGSGSASGQPAPGGSSAATLAPAANGSSAAGSSSATAAPSGTASASSSATTDAGPAVCERSGERVWSAGANKLTGLTTKGFSGKVAVGLAIGNDPHVLVVDKDGTAKLMKVKQGDKAKRPDPKEGFRNLLRVSPSAIDGDEARAFIDYRDDYKDKRRHVWCGPADADDKFLEFDGKSWLDMDPKPEGDDKKKLFSWKKLGGYVELRDCRTFVSHKDNEVYALGSVLRGIEKPDGTNEWKMVFLVDFGPKDDEIVLHETPLKGDPPKPVSTFEIPMSRRLGDKGFLVATRFGGSLMVGLLDSDRHLVGSFHNYAGFPSMPDISTTDATQLVLTAGIGVGQNRALKYLLISKTDPELPKEYHTIKLEPTGTSEGDASFTAPELTEDTKGRRWLVYAEGPANKGHLRITPLGIDMQPAGRTFNITDGDSYAGEARLVALPGGKLVVVYLRDKDGKTELVSEHLSCEIMN